MLCGTFALYCDILLSACMYTYLCMPPCLYVHLPVCLRVDMNIGVSPSIACVLVFSTIRTTGRRRSVVTVTPSPKTANADAKPVTGTRRYSTAAAQFPGMSHTLGGVRRQSVADAGNRSATLGGRRMSAYSRRDALQDLNEEELFGKGEEEGERKRKSSLEGIKGLLRSSAKKTLGRRRRRSSGEGLGEKQSSTNSQDTFEEFEKISRSTSDARCSTLFCA